MCLDCISFFPENAIFRNVVQKCYHQVHLLTEPPLYFHILCFLTA